MCPTAHVSVPGTSANLGAGFDCIGLAIDRRLDASATVTPHGAGGVTIERSGTLAQLDVHPESDLLYTGFSAAAAAARQPFTGDVHFTGAFRYSPRAWTRLVGGCHRRRSGAGERGARPPVDT